jgi:SAM-dependent methyltransferase
LKKSGILVTPMQLNEYDKMFAFENDYWWYRGLHELVESRIGMIRLGRNLTIFDAGCGTGRCAQILETYGTVEGIDYSPAAIDYCKRRGLKHCRVGDLNEWQPTGDRYDVIVSLDVLCCEGIRDDGQILGKFYHALRTKGLLILNLPAFPLLRRIHDAAVSVARRYRKGNVVRDLRRLGFTVTYAGYRLPFLFFIMVAKKVSEKMMRRTTIESDLTLLPSWMNLTFLNLHRLENGLINRGMRFPFGGSLFLVVEKIGGMTS